MEFTIDELLPPGDHELTLSALRSSLLVVGDGSSDGWNASWRLKLVERLNLLDPHKCWRGMRTVERDTAITPSPSCRCGIAIA